MKETPPAKIGTWLFGGTVLAHVTIRESDVAYGSGDYEDDPEIQNDMERACFYVRWYSPGDSIGVANSGSDFGPFDSLDAAVAYVAASEGVVGLSWQE